MDQLFPGEPSASSSEEFIEHIDILSLSPSLLSPEFLHTKLLPLSDIETLTTCSNLINAGKIEDVQLARYTIEFGLARVDKALQQIEAKIRDVLGTSQGDWDQVDHEDIRAAVATVVSNNEGNMTLLEGGRILHDARRRIDTFEVFFPPDSAPGRANAGISRSGEANPSGDGAIIIDDPWAEADGDDASVDEPILDDPWEAADSESNLTRSAKADQNTNTIHPPSIDEISEPPIALSTFLTLPLPISALSLAAAASVSALRVVCERHVAETFPYRFHLLDALPLWVPPVDLQSANLLPQIGVDGKEKPWPWLYTAESKTIFDVLPQEYRSPAASFPATEADLVTSDSLSSWYERRILSLDSLGFLDLQIAWVQFGTSHGVIGLDALGEDLSLFSRLIYDAKLTSSQEAQWSVASWRTASEEEKVKAYLSNTTTESVVSDIKRLVLPHLHVIESRAERAGKAEPHLADRLLHNAILGLPLRLVLPVFEASKATLLATNRLLRNDINVARLALACLYGSDQRDDWATMSAIFECLPVWDVSGGDLEADKEATSMTLDSIATFVRPTKAGLKPPTAHD
ncbi:MAG: hypothetical protein TREMPRED_003153, partial [Tremellales sp. Tagirdzhanova-0007]